MGIKTVVVLLIFMLIPISIYLLYSSGIEPKSLSMEILHLNFVNCKIAPEWIQNSIDNLTDFFNGVFYDSPILLCVEHSNKAYCLQSKVYKIYDISIIYFDTICYLQKEIDSKLPYIIFKHEIIDDIKNISDIVEYYNKGMVIVSDKKIIDALINENP